MGAEPLIDLAALGTPERTWARWRHRRPELSLTGWRHLIVVAPHPDDEVLGVGGLIALARSRGLPVTVVTVTDGEASHPGSPTCSPAELGDLRVQESRRAAKELNVDAPIRLRIGDGRVAAHEAAVTDALSDILTRCGHTGAWCATTWRRDGHPDHEAVGRATAAACAGTATRLLEFPVRMWHWATPEHPVVPASRARTLTLPGSAVDAKVRALAQFRSQILPMSDDPADQPILSPTVLDRFTGNTETFFV
ncbi:PIG-L deacetylase family protein [Nocardia sp. XZ_19_369]|uniref:PIG-L deacetylase family protein n=1 Tax=Nocardia sp. XZ_19_369 TaxID=2769487 RepID=UPI00188E2F22|nr:PIG-L deacetylase family protein [Nocardia sp. XZ_19_369]